MLETVHTYYHTCPYCGANLDPGESCDCQKESNDSTITNVTEKSEVNQNDKEKHHETE